MGAMIGCVDQPLTVSEVARTAADLTRADLAAIYQLNSTGTPELTVWHAPSREREERACNAELAEFVLEVRAAVVLLEPGRGFLDGLLRTRTMRSALGQAIGDNLFIILNSRAPCAFGRHAIQSLEAIAEGWRSREQSRATA